MKEITSEGYLNFLLEVLETVRQNPSPESVYPLLQRNLDKLDENLGLTLQNWANETLTQVNSEQAYGMAGTILNFSFLIQQFSLGNKAIL